MEYNIETRVVLTLEHEPKEKTSALKHIEFNLEVSGNVDSTIFFDKEDLPSAAGSSAITHCMVQGLISNIHYAHQKGFRNDVEHLKTVLKQIEEGFARVATVYKSEFPNLKKSC